MKYDTMIAKNKVESEKKIQIAKEAITEMLEQGESIIVAALVKKTGLSRGFFYKNLIVRQTLEEAIYKQRISYGEPCKVGAGDKKEDTIIKQNIQIEELQIKNTELFAMNQQLLKEIEELKKKINRKGISLLKKL